ncbi:MAG: glycoside hydrolase [Thermoanaerobaculales bacterium]|nr:glycoside hydrolase [Thermoanaerobaculales bacterium]
MRVRYARCVTALLWFLAAAGVFVFEAGSSAENLDAIAGAEQKVQSGPRQPVGRGMPMPIRFDCTGVGSRCPEFVPLGDAADHLPGYGPSPFRGFADPSIREDPDTGRLWMAYSWPHVKVAPMSTVGVVGVVDIHLAHSDDSGATWLYDGSLWSAQGEDDPGGSGASGYSSYEVVSLAPHARAEGTVWYGVRARYFAPDSGTMTTRRGDSFHLGILQADSPPELATAAEVRLGSFLTAPGWAVDIDLTSLAPEVADCAIWNEPALHIDGNTLYLTVVCLVFDLSNGERVPLREHIPVFATEPSGEVDSWSWRYVGRLCGSGEAAELGGETLTQVDLVRGRDGALLALLTPNDWDPTLGADIHHGCVVVEVAGLNPPALARSPSGALRVRAAITASDLELYGPAASGYDPASSTGIVFVRREWSTEEMVWTLHRTGLHP